MDLNFSNSKEYIKTLDLIIQKLERGNAIKLKQISNELTELSVTRNDNSILYLAVILYCMYKVFTQNHIVNTHAWRKNKEIFISFFDKLKVSDKSTLKYQLTNFVNLFKNKNYEIYNYVKHIERKGKIKVGARLYSLGLSTKRIVGLLNINLFDLQRYLSDSQIHNQRKIEKLIQSKVNLLLKETRDLIFDSSSLISIGNAGILYLFEKFKAKNPKVNLYITPGVHQETIDIQKKVIRYGWLGTQYEYLIKKGVFTLIPKSKLPEDNTLEDVSNSTFYTKHGKLEILQKGELESVVFAKKNNCILVIDEIITRWLIESPLKLHKLMESRYKEKVMYDPVKLKESNNLIKGVPVVRSVDFVAFAIKRDYFKEFKDLDFKKSLLYSIKYNGCATSYEEIDLYLKGDGHV